MQIRTSIAPHTATMRRMAAICALSLFCAGLAPCATSVGKPPAEDANIHRFPNDPNVWVDRAGHRVFIKAQLSPDLTTVYSVLEFLLVSGRYNAREKMWMYEKGYESAFVTKADPNNVHLALLLAGLRPGPLQADVPKGLSKGTMGGEFGGRPADSGKPGGKDAPRATAPMLDIIVQWREGDTVRSKRVEHFLFDRGNKGTAKTTPWAFTGSYIATAEEGKKVLAASRSRILIGTFFDESAIINLPYFTLNPYSSTGGLEVNAFYLPPYFSKDKDIVEGYKHRKIKIPVHRFVTLVISPSKLKAPDPRKRTRTGTRKATDKKPPAAPDTADKKNVQGAKPAPATPQSGQ